MNMTKLIKSTRSGILRSTLALAALAAGWAGTTMGASPYTWTKGTAATHTWTTAANWSGNNVDSGPGTSTDTLTFYADTTTALIDGNILITTSVPELTMNVLTLNGKGPGSGTGTFITIGTSATTWTLDGTSPTVNLNSLFGGGTKYVNYTVAVNLALNQEATFTGNGTAGNTFNFSGNITGPGMGISKSGTSTLTLSGNNTYSGLTTVSAGVLTLSGTTGSGGVTLGAGTLNINSAGALGTGTFTISGGTIDNTSGSAKTLSTVTPITLSANFTFSATKALNLGNSAVTLGTTVTILGGTIGVPLTIGGVITGGANGLTLSKGAMVILTGTNNYSGQTYLANNAGGLNILRADNGVGLPTNSNLLIKRGVFETGTDLIRAGGTGANQMQIASASNPSPKGFSAFGAPVRIAFGTSLGSLEPLTWGSGNFITDAGLLLNNTTANNTLEFKNAVNLNNAVQTVTVNATDSAAFATMSGALSGTGSSGLTKAGGGTLVLSGANTYPGATRVSAGTLKAGIASVAGVSGAFGLNSAVTNDNVAGVTLDLNGFDTQIGSLAGGGALGGNVTLGTNTLTTGANNTSTTFAGVISGSNTCSLVKTGTGTMTLTGVNTYTGDTTVSDGTLKLSVASTLDDSSSLKIVTGAGKNPKVELAGGTETVNAFYIDGKQQAKGTWGASGSSYLTGTGVLDVKTGPLRGTMIMIF